MLIFFTVHICEISLASICRICTIIPSAHLNIVFKFVLNQGCLLAETVRVFQFIQIRVEKNLRVQQYKDDGWLLLKANQLWSEEEVNNLIKYANELDSWPEAPGKWMKYFETSLKDGSRILQRTENFFQYHNGFNEMFNGERFLGIMSDLMDGQPAVLFKEKINYKLPGGGSFKPHQDAQAGWGVYGHTFHISVLVTIDEADAENGCLEIVRGAHKNGLLGPEWKELDADVTSKLKWELAPTKPGDVIVFDSFVPHRSGPNLSSRQRRVLYATYNKVSEGDYRAQYYIDKRKGFPPDIEREPGKVYEYKI